MKLFRTVCALFAMVGLYVGGQAFGAEVNTQWPGLIYSNQVTTLKLQSVSLMEVNGTLPDDPGVRILGHREFPGGEDDTLHRMEIDILPLRAGRIILPPIPLRLDGRNLLYQIPEWEVEENPTPTESHELFFLWNGKTRQPAYLYEGQRVDLEILQIVPRVSLRPRFLAPVVDIPFVDFAGTRRRNGTISPFITLTRGLFSSSSHSQEDTQFRGVPVRVQRTKVMFSVPAGLSLVEGRVYASGGHRGRPLRTHLSTLSIPVRTLPSSEGREGENTALVGTWTFNAILEPALPKPGERFALTINVEGEGDMDAFVLPDFEAPGFLSLSRDFKKKSQISIEESHGVFRQEFLAKADAVRFPAVQVLSFDSEEEQWNTHRLLEEILLTEEVPVVDAREPVAPRVAVQRPVLLNLSRSLVAWVVFAPLIPLLARLGQFCWKRFHSPERVLRRQIRLMSRELPDAPLPKDRIDSEILPLLRRWADLPRGATATELSRALKGEHPDLAEEISRYAQSSFGDGEATLSGGRLSKLMARLSLFFLLGSVLFQPLHAVAANLPEGVEPLRELVEDEPSQPLHHWALAEALVGEGELHEARAVAHTLLLLDPLPKEFRSLMNQIRNRLGEPNLPGAWLLSLRPDQYLSIAAVFWILGFLLIAVRMFFRKLPLAVIGLVFVFTVAGGLLSISRQHGAYQTDQFMVVVPETFLHSAPGQADLQHPPLRSGDIVQLSDSQNDGEAEDGDYLNILVGESHYFVRRSDLLQVW